MRPVSRMLADLPRNALLALVRAYRFFISPWRPASCRFEPTCSAYALDALARHGAGAGTYLAVHRVLRCGPWCSGGIDPVPVHVSRLFRGRGGRAAPSSVSTSPSPP